VQESTLRETLLRISGAIQVLDEVLAAADHGPGDRDDDARPDTEHADRQARTGDVLTVP
jgi:hypothetical protein